MMECGVHHSQTFLLPRYKKNGEPKDDFAPRFYELMDTLASTIARMYPGWRMRIYHNVTEEDEVTRDA